jgi:SAM-dependent methyltransferase
MTRLNWQTPHKISVDSYDVTCSDELYEQAIVDTGIRRDSKIKHRVKTICWPILSLRNKLFVDGFVYRTIAAWAKDFINEETTYLEVGCGNMELHKMLPDSVCYNAFDISLSEFHIKRTGRARKFFNIALASATDIPLESSCVNLIVACEVFEHIPRLKDAIREIYRIALPEAKLLCSIPNNFCYKYQQKGSHPDHVNKFAFRQFIDFMESGGFRFQKGSMKGWWIPLPKWMTTVSYQLPLHPRKEFYCTNFIYQFEVNK